MNKRQLTIKQQMDEAVTKALRRLDCISDSFESAKQAKAHLTQYLALSDQMNLKGGVEAREAR